jgi:hypothetical protein
MSLLKDISSADPVCDEAVTASTNRITALQREDWWRQLSEGINERIMERLGMVGSKRARQVRYFAWPPIAPRKAFFNDRLRVQVELAGKADW